MSTDFLQQKRVTQRVVENGNVLKDVDYTVIRHGPNQIMIQGYNRDQPFIMTNMSASALRKKYKKTTKKKTAKKSHKKNKSNKKK
jgi:hypothetical protein